MSTALTISNFLTRVRLSAGLTMIPMTAVLLFSPSHAFSARIHPDFDAHYTLTNLGTVPGIPVNAGGLGGLTIKRGDSNTLLLASNAGHRTGTISSVPLTRDANGNITGFAGLPEFFSSAYGLTGGIDGSLVYGPDGILLYTSYPDNHIGQIRPGSTAPDKLVNLIPLTGVASSVGAMQIVPGGIPGAGRLKFASYSVSRWYDAVISPDGNGLYDIQVMNNPGIFIGGSPEGILYVPELSPLFPNPSVLVTEFSYGMVAAYEVDVNGDPIVATRQTFIDGLYGAEGITQDPLTGDLLLSTFTGGNLILRVDLRNAPGDISTPEPASGMLTAAALIAVLAACRRLRLRA